MNLIRLNEKPLLTNYLVSQGTFKDNPLKFCDIGARGGLPTFITHYEDQIEITGFEADQEETDRLNEVFNGRIKVYPYALHRDKGKRTFYVTNKPASSSFYEPNNFMKRFWNSKDLEVVKTIELETVDLDSLNLSFDFIKLDTEGSELDILEGGKETLKNLIGLTVETEFTATHKKQPLFRDVDFFLNQYGFKLYDLIPYLYGRKCLRAPKGEDNWGQVIVGQALYFRDGFYEEWDLIKILKQVTLMELFCLNDSAIELIYKTHLRELIDKKLAYGMINLLIPERLKNEYIKKLQAYKIDLEGQLKSLEDKKKNLETILKLKDETEAQIPLVRGALMWVTQQIEKMGGTICP